ncbi:hypothetical protein D3C71_1286630 [compost metagenome]
MTLHQKAGIVIGVMLFVLAGVIYWFFGDKPKAEEVSISSASSFPQETATPTPVVTTPPPAQIQEGKEGYVSTEGVVSKKIFKEVDENSLGDPANTVKEVMVVAKKKVVLMDSNAFNVGEDYNKEGKQLYYVVDVGALSGTTKLSLYLNYSAYSSLNIGDKLSVTYKLYKNKSQIEFPLVISTEKLE